MEKNKIISGIVGLVVGVVVGVAVYRLTIERAILEYDVIESETFAGEKQSISIVALKVYNSGNKEAQDFTSEIAIDKGTITDYRISGLPATAYTFTNTLQSLLVTAPYFNAGETLTMQVLVNNGSEGTLPSYDVRGKGVNGKPRNIQSSKASARSLVFTALAAGMVALVTVLTYLLGLWRR